MGLWILQNYSNKKREKGKNEEKKQVQIAIDIVKNYLENGLDYLGKENKYNFFNKFGPKKFPDKQIKRESITMLYSWSHYAPNTWYEHIKKIEDEMKQSQDKKDQNIKKCSFCSAPESVTRKHKVCSACKKAFYCSADC